MSGNTGKSNPRRRQPSKNITSETIRLRERRRQAIELRRANHTFAQIAEQLGYAQAANARRDILAALEEITKQPAEELLTEELDRLAAMLTGIWEKASSGDPQAIDKALKILDMRARYRGLYAPTKQTITIIPEDAIDAEIARLTEKLAEHDLAPDEADADI